MDACNIPALGERLARDVDQQFYNFGSSGAIAFACLSVLVLVRLL